MIPAGARSTWTVTGGATTSGGANVVMASTATVPSGTPISGTGIPAGTYINVLDGVSGNLVDINGAAITATATGSGLTFTMGSAGYISTNQIPQENVRQAVNKWIRTKPYNIAGVFDFDRVIRAAVLQANADPAFVQVYPHPELDGYEQAGALVRF